jgi:hypothetical protein
MKKHNNFSYLNKVLVIALSVVMIACSQFEDTPVNPNMDSSESAAAWNLNEISQNRFNASQVPVTGTASTPISAGGVTPYIIDGANNGGNRTCEEVATATGLSFASSSGKLDYEGGRFENADGTVGSWPTGFTITTDGTYVTWSYSRANYRLVNAAFIVKGSDDANVYAYEGVAGDSGLASPLNGGGNTAGLSNLTICFTEEFIPPHCVDNETAWAGLNVKPADQRYTTKGNWAYWVTRVQLSAGLTVWAGQHINAGTAVLRGDNKIEITLTNGWMFKSGEGVENVKIEFYQSRPSGNPSPGRFTYKNTATGSSYISAEVPSGTTHFGIHLDVEKSRACAQ